MQQQLLKSQLCNVETGRAPSKTPDNVFLYRQTFRGVNQCNVCASTGVARPKRLMSVRHFVAQVLASRMPRLNRPIVK